MVDLFTALPYEVLPGMTSINWLQVMHGLIVLAKVSFLTMPHWDVQYVRNTINFSAMVDRINEKFSAVHERERVHWSNSSPSNSLPRWVIYTRKMTQCKKWFEAKVEAETQSRPPNDADRGTFQNDLFADELLDGFDEWDWPELLGYDVDLPNHCGLGAGR